MILSKCELDVLYELFNKGHQEDAELSSISGMNCLIEKGLAKKDSSMSFPPNYITLDGIRLINKIKEEKANETY